jgi:hypothetical protein
MEMSVPKIAVVVGMSELQVSKTFPAVLNILLLYQNFIEINSD